MRTILYISIFFTIGLLIGLDTGDVNVHVKELVWIDRPDSIVNLGELWTVNCWLQREVGDAQVDFSTR